MRIDILTLFPEMFDGPLSESMIRIAREKNILKIKTHSLRKWTKDKHRTADDRPFGGGAGMIIKVEPIYRALNELKPDPKAGKENKATVILLTPQGKTFTQQKAKELSLEGHLIMICGHYEGVDERIRSLVDMEISIGDYILTGGEIPVCVIVDSVTRLIPGVLGDHECVKQETFEDDLLEHPQYTRPREFKGMKVPEVLLSGDHKKIESWKNKQSKKRTRERRPDIIGEQEN